MPTDQSTTLRVLNPLYGYNSDVVGVGGPLTVENLLWAYRHGVFPWPTPGYPLLWFCPLQRAVLDFADLHVPRRLARRQRNSPFSFTIDRAFNQVIQSCREVPRPGHEGTWITPAIVKSYQELHRAGFAHSVECWDAAGALVGGLYGVSVEGAFAGESMFHTVPDASKLALLHLIGHLQARQLGWMDIQMLTSHMETLGARLLPRDVYLQRLQATRARGLVLFPQTYLEKGVRPPPPIITP